MRPLLLTTLLLFLGAAPVLAQETSPAGADTTTAREVHVEYADLLERTVIDGERVRSLTGNVRLIQDETRLRANRAIHNRARGEILFVGDVEIIERGDSLSADTVFYNTRTKVGHATGNVWLSDGDVVVFAPSGTYETRSKHALFDSGVTLVDSSTTLTSLEGEYWSDERRAEFYGNVRLEEEESTLVADSVTYHRDEEVSLARGNVALLHLDEDDDSDAVSQTYLFGERAYNDNRNQLSRIGGNPLLVQVRRDSLGAPRDTLVMRADELVAVRSDTLERLTGIHNVRVWQERLSAIGDSLVYDRHSGGEGASRERALLFGNPSAWVDEMQLDGDTIRIAGTDGAIDSLFANSRSFLAQYDSTLERIHQVKGRDLVASFREDTIRSMRTWPNAEAIYFLKDDEDGLRGGVRGSGDEIIFGFVAGDLQRVSIVSGTEGQYVPAEHLPDPFELEGFRWSPQLRPHKELLIQDQDLEQPFDPVRRGPPVALREFSLDIMTSHPANDPE